MRPTAIDPRTGLATRPPGSALYTRARADGGPWETVWLIREETARLTTLGEAPDVEWRAAAWDEQGLLVIPILVRVWDVQPPATHCLR